MEIKRVGSQPSGKGPSEWFTGTVRIDPLFNPGRLKAQSVEACSATGVHRRGAIQL